MKKLKPQKALVIANGIQPKNSIVKKIVSTVDYIICADGGANHALKMRIKPDVIIGDLDSITPKTKKYYQNVPIIFVGDRDSTDLEKAIKFCIVRNIKIIDIIGATGDRIDHTIGNLGCFKKFGKKVTLKIIDPAGELFLVRKNIKLNTIVRKNISLIPLDQCEGVTTKNLKYSLKNDSLELGIREGTTNKAISDNVTIDLRSGTLLLYHLHN